MNRITIGLTTTIVATALLFSFSLSLTGEGKEGDGGGGPPVACGPAIDDGAVANGGQEPGRHGGGGPEAAASSCPPISSALPSPPSTNVPGDDVTKSGDPGNGTEHISRPDESKAP